MRLRLLDRIRRSRRRQQPDKVRARDRGDGGGAVPGPTTPGAAGAHRRVGSGRPAPSRPSAAQSAKGAQPANGAQPIQGAQPANGTRPGGQAPQAAGSPRQASGRGGQAGHALPRRWAIARVATRSAPKADAAAGPAARAQAARAQAARAQAARAQAARAQAARGQAPQAVRTEARPPWYEIAQSNRTAAGRRHCGHIEKLIHREWADDVTPPPEVVRAIDRLAELPQIIKARLAAGLDAIYVGIGGVPNLDDMGRLKGIPLPSGRATWDACAGAYGERKIIVGSRPSPSPDVMCHEIGHALDDIDGSGEQWQSDSEEFHSLYDQCLPHMVSAFHAQPGLLGRREFFADAFAAIASRQRPALVEMLGGDTRSALNVMLYFNVRYGI
jgi:hypothetical protein